MSESDPTPQAPEEAPDSNSDGKAATGRNPGAGCLIMVIALASLSFLIGFGIWGLFKQDREIAKFTAPEPQELPLPDLEANAGDVIALNALLETFANDHGNKREAEITLTPEQINLAIAAFDQFEDLRKSISVKSITKDEMHLEIAFKMRGSPTKGGYRYLNGTMVAKPELTGGEIIFLVDRIEVPGKTVPEGFVGVFSPYRPGQEGRAYHEDEFLGPWMKKLTAISLADGGLTFKITPDAAPPGVEPRKIESGHILRAVVLFGAVLLGFSAIATMAFKRGKRLH